MTFPLPNTRFFRNPEFGIRGARRYGFQAQERDGEMWGGSVTYKYRVEDPRLGRFFSVDPLYAEYPWNSNYAFCENRLIDGIELEGLEYKPINDANGKTIGAEYVGFDKDGCPVAGSVTMVAWEETKVVDGKNVSFLTYTDCTMGYGTTSIQSNANGMVELPQDDPSQLNGKFTINHLTIYATYNRNDVNGKKDQYGKPLYIANLINAIVEYNSVYGDVITIGDMKSPTNGKVPISASSYHHSDEGAFDIRLIGKNGTYKGEVYNPNFSIIKSQFFFDCLGKHGFSRVIISSKVAGKFKNTGSLKVKADTSKIHDNHYHVDMN